MTVSYTKTETAVGLQHESLAFRFSTSFQNLHCLSTLHMKEKPKTLRHKVSRALGGQGHQVEAAGTSLVVQWVRLHLTMQGMRVRSLVGEQRPHMPCGQKTKTETAL